MFREIIRPQSESYVVHIPEEYINTDVEILVLPFNMPTTTSQDDQRDVFTRTAGILAFKNIDPLEWQSEIRSEWSR